MSVSLKEVRIVATPIRLRMLQTALDGREFSAKSMSTEMGVALGLASYHVTTLAGVKFLRNSRTVPRRGAAERFYVLNGHRRADVAQIVTALSQFA